MESSSSPPSDSDRTANSNAAKFLSNLPSRGLFSSSTVLSSNLGGMRVYVCVHDTDPPESQMIKTNQQNILIRSLTLKNKKGDSSSKEPKSSSGATESSRKRIAERVLDSKASSKKANTLSNSRQEGTSGQSSNKDFQGLTVERLRALLKAKGLSIKGKKDELIGRLRGSSC